MKATLKQMKPDDFEQKLERQSLRQIPSEWREEILSAAQTGSRPTPRASLLSTINHQLSTLLWPCPQAWAGLAVVWILIFTVDFSVRDKTPVLAEKSTPLSPEMLADLRRQQRLLAELMGPRDINDTDRPKSLTPRPRSECVEFMTA
jgi:hypothetical protein